MNEDLLGPHDDTFVSSFYHSLMSVFDLALPDCPGEKGRRIGLMSRLSLTTTRFGPRLYALAIEADVADPRRFLHSPFDDMDELEAKPEDWSIETMASLASQLRQMLLDLRQIQSHLGRIKRGNPAEWSRRRLRQIQHTADLGRSFNSVSCFWNVTGVFRPDQAIDWLMHVYTEVGQLADRLDIQMPRPWVPPRVANWPEFREATIVLGEAIEGMLAPPADTADTADSKLDVCVVKDDATFPPVSPTARPAEPDEQGPFVVGSFRWKSEIVELTDKPWQVLKAMWPLFSRQGSRAVEDLAEAIWDGENLDRSQAKSRLKPHLSNINSTLDTLSGFSGRLKARGFHVRWVDKQ